MQSIKDGSAATRNDPIWHRLRVESIWYLLLGILLLVSIVTSLNTALKEANGTNVLFYGIYLLVFVKLAVDRFRGPSYWRRIGRRRDEALRGVQIPASPFQPTSDETHLSMPTTFSMRWHTLTWIMGGIIVVLAVVSWVGLAIILLARLDMFGNGLFILTFVLGILLAVVLVIGMFYYFAFLRYRMQHIEVTEEGLRVYYMRRDCFLRWDEVRVFASYGAQWTAKSSQTRAYEVASEQMVVRWSPLPIFNMFFSVQSDPAGKEDWNWLVNRLNTYVSERTGLVLLDLSDKAVKRSASRPVSQASAPHQEPGIVATTSEPMVRPIAQNDTLVQRLQWHGDTGKALKGLGVLSVIFIAFGVLRLFPMTGQGQIFLSVGHGDFFPVLVGIMLLLLTVLGAFSIQAAQKYWRGIETLRMRALAQLQPLAEHRQSAASLPQPTILRIRYSRPFMFLLASIVGFVFFFIIFYVFSDHESLLLIAIISLALALICGLVQMLLAHKASERRIEVTSDGIATYMSTIYGYVRWEDVRLFSSYRALALFNRKGNIVTYELAGENTVIRIMGASKNWNLFVPEPKMSRAEFERWHEQLIGYIEQRTNLPLMDLDNLDQK